MPTIRHKKTRVKRKLVKKWIPSLYDKRKGRKA